MKAPAALSTSDEILVEGKAGADDVG
jgi:hypothetical protein